MNNSVANVGQDYWKLRPHAPASGSQLGDARDIAEGAAKEFTFGRGRSAFRMFVVRRDARYHGYLNICPHYSLPLNHEPDGFMKHGFIECAQHFARFDVEHGRCFAGACEGQSLVRVPVSETGEGQLVIL